MAITDRDCIFDTPITNDHRPVFDPIMDHEKTLYHPALSVYFTATNLTERRLSLNRKLVP